LIFAGRDLRFTTGTTADVPNRWFRGVTIRRALSDNGSTDR
jgi:hypothetical protein